MWIIVLFLLASPMACAQNPDVRSAFAQARRGNLQPLANLNVTAADVPAIAEFARDTNEDVAREAVTLLQKLGGPAACAGLVPALASASADVRERSARALYASCPHRLTEGTPQLAASLRKSIEMGNASAAALLLLGRFHDHETQEFLKHRFEAATPEVKLNPWSTPVPQGLAAAVAAVSAGLREARPRLVEGLKQLDQAEFLASVMPDITDMDALRNLLPLLDNQQVIRAGVPSGAQPQRRLCDMAVDSFTRRLDLRLSFALRPSGRYSAEELAEVNKFVAAATRR